MSTARRVREVRREYATYGEGEYDDDTAKVVREYGEGEYDEVDGEGVRRRASTKKASNG